MNRKVIASIESADGTHCVDIFRRDDSSFGFEEFRSEFDGAARWQNLAKYSTLVFVSGEAALSDAQNRVQWLNKSETWRWQCSPLDHDGSFVMPGLSSESSGLGEEWQFFSNAGTQPLTSNVR